MDEQSPHPMSDAFVSPESLSNTEEFSTNPRFLELQEELRCTLVTGVESLRPSRSTSPHVGNTADGSAAEVRKEDFDFSRVSIPKIRLIYYLTNWIDKCAPFLDKFDEARHFGIQVPVIAQRSPALFYAILAFSARQLERKSHSNQSYDSLELYQESIKLLASSLQEKDPNVLVTACVLACLELMSGSSRNWRRHVEGCAALFDRFGVNGFSGGLSQVVFWCYARMDLCGALNSDGAESTVLHVDKWIPAELVASPNSRADSEDLIKDMFSRESSASVDMHANWAVYLCAKTCDLVNRWTMCSESGQIDNYDQRPYLEQWSHLWEELQYWYENRCPEMLPIKTGASDDGLDFPEILFVHWAAISGNQLYHTACLLMLEVKPAVKVLPCPGPIGSLLWHARRICGISLTNPHSGSLINAIQPLFIAGRLLSHPTEQLTVARLIKTTDKTTGWGAIWRLKDLERAWGYESGEILNAI